MNKGYPMRKITSKKLRLGITLKVFKNGRPVQTITKHKKSRIFKDIDRINFELGSVKVLLRVSYSDGWNESEHSSKESLLNALYDYTNKNAMEYLEKR